MRLTKADCRELLEKTFPNYKGRKFFLRIEKEYYIKDSYWDGGTRTYAHAIDLDKGVEMLLPERKYEGKTFQIPENVVIALHSYFCGHDQGITFVMPPNSPYLPKNLIEAGK